MPFVVEMNLIFGLGFFLLTMSPQSETGEVVGQILSHDGKPAAGVRVSATPVDQNDSIPSTLVSLAETDSAGRYRLDRIPAGRYFIMAGLVTAPTYYPGVSALSRASPIVISAGTVISGIDIQLVFSTPGRMAMPAGAIEGQLRSEDGSPVGNLRIQARLAPATSNPTGTTLSVISFTETDSAGRYRMDGLPPGSYYIEAGPLGAPRAYFPGAADFVAAKPVAVATSAISGLDFTMPPVPPTFSISGRVTLPPNVNRFPNLVRLENSANLPQFGSITPDGSFRIDHVRAGSYQLWTVPAIAGLPSVRFDVVVTDHDVTTLELVFDRK